MQKPKVDYTQKHRRAASIRANDDDGHKINVKLEVVSNNGLVLDEVRRIRPLFEHESWRWRWMVTRSYEVLHRVKSGKPTRDRFVGVLNAETVCGLRGKFFMPGIFSRMGRKRCAKCCAKLGIPQGDGAPFNAFRKKSKYRES